MSHTKHRRRGFTLIELLVVIAIIAILLSMLMPSLQGARVTARKVKCQANMRSINMGISHFRDEHDGWGWKFDKNNGARFDLTGAPLDPDDPLAYWGVAYDPYLESQLSPWTCPSFVLMDPYPYFSTDWTFIEETQRYQTYGINGVSPRNDRDLRTSIWGERTVTETVIIRGRPTTVRSTGFWLRPAEKIPFPDHLIVFQDAWEHKLDNNGDTLNQLSQYDSDYGGQFTEVWRREYFRHGNACHLMYADGHLDQVKEGFVPREGRPELLYNYTGNEDDR